MRLKDIAIATAAGIALGLALIVAVPAKSQGVTVQQLPPAPAPMAAGDAVWCGQPGTVGGKTYKCSGQQLGDITRLGNNTWQGANTFNLPIVLTPQGSPPPSPPNGSLWTSSAGIFVQVNGSTIGPFNGTVTSVTCNGGLNGGTFTGAGTCSLTVPVTAANGGTNCTTPSGACLDNITGFSFTGIAKRTGAGAYGSAVSGTDYAPATSGSSILEGNGAGGFSAVSVGSGLSFSSPSLGIASIAANSILANFTGSSGVPGAASVPTCNATNNFLTYAPGSPGSIGCGAATGGSGGVGTVTSVALTMPGEFSVSGSPITGAGTLAVTRTTQSANVGLFGPTSGAAATPTFRLLVGADLPNPSATTLGGVESFASVSHQFIKSISTAGVPAAAQPACGDLSDAAASCNTDATNAGNITSGTLAAARGGAGTVNGILKANGSGVVSAAVSGTDYAPATSGSAILSGNGSGSFSNVTIGSGITFAGGTLSASGSGGTVTTTGSPATGELTKFSGASSITNGDLTGVVTTSGGLATTATNPFVIGTPQIGSGTGTMPNTYPEGSEWMQTDNGLLATMWTVPSAVPGRVQENSAVGGYGLTLGSSPTPGNYLIALCASSSALPSAASGWVSFSSQSRVGSLDPYVNMVQHKITHSDSTSQTACTGGGGAEAVAMKEVTGLDMTNFSNSLVSTQYASASDSSGAGHVTTSTISTATASNNNEALAFASAINNALATGGGLSIGGTSFTNVSSAASGVQSPGNNALVGSLAFPTSGSTVTLNATAAPGGVIAEGVTAVLVILQPSTDPSTTGAQQVSYATVIKNGSTVIAGGSAGGPGFRSLYFPSGCASADADFNVTISCGGTLTPTGSPASGNLAKWSGSGTLTNGDLSGDCTTSATLATTCLKTNGTSFGTFATQNFATPPHIGGTTPNQGDFSGILDTGLAGTGARCVHTDASGNLAPTTGDCATGGSGSVTSVTCDGVVITTSGVCPPGLVPQGRLTLVTGTPVLTSDQTAKSQVFYDCYAGKFVPYYDGTNDQAEAIASCEVSLTMQTSGTGVTNNAGVFDVWWVHSGANRLCVATNGSGGGWASDTGGSNTARGTGYSQIHNTRGYWTNANSISHCYNGTTDYGSVNADQATYLGSLATTAAGQTGVALKPAGASGGNNTFVGLWNAYRQVLINTWTLETACGFTTSTTTFSTFNASNSNRITVVDGIGQSSIATEAWSFLSMDGAGHQGAIGVREDATTGTPIATALCTFTTFCTVQVFDHFTPAAGLHFFQIMEGLNSGTGTATYCNGGETINLMAANDNGRESAKLAA